ncbi:MAG: YARHG domain-containing protein [Bacteroidales bacterium]|nr:YARHG domain-containing protein [Bacteroidales bacterium]
MKKSITSIMLAMLGLSSTLANDGVYFTSGNQLIPLLETDISIRKEVLTIGLQDDGNAHVDVYYEFFNPGTSDKTVLMGFEADPSYNDDYEFHADGKHPSIIDFTVEMNGKKLSYQNAVCEVNNLDGLKPLDMTKYEVGETVTTVHPKGNDTLYIDFAYVYYFEATFKPGLNKVHHTYQYTRSMQIGTTFEVEYKLTPAARWANHQIDDFTLVIRADNTAKHYIIDEETFNMAPWMLTEGFGKQRVTDYYDSPFREFSLRNGAFTWHKNNFTPKHELVITSADRIYNFNENAAFGSFYDRNSSFALYYSEQNSVDDKLRTRIAHNLPYANRGHVFKDPVLKAYFQNLWWYMPDPNYQDDQSDFTDVDRSYLSY